MFLGGGSRQEKRARIDASLGTDGEAAASAAAGGAAAADTEAEEEGYRAFGGREAKGVLFKITPIDDSLRERVEQYVHEGAMDADLRFVRDLYGLVDPSRKRDFEHFWESPWLEEHACDAARKRKLDARQRSMAARSYIHSATSAAAADGAAEAASGGGSGGRLNVDRFLSTVDRLNEWVDRSDAKDVRTYDSLSAPSTSYV